VGGRKLFESRAVSERVRPDFLHFGEVGIAKVLARDKAVVGNISYVKEVEGGQIYIVEAEHILCDGKGDGKERSDELKSLVSFCICRFASHLPCNGRPPRRV
jgi:hypothetical protein